LGGGGGVIGFWNAESVPGRIRAYMSAADEVRV